MDQWWKHIEESHFLHYSKYWNSTSRFTRILCAQKIHFLLHPSIHILYPYSCYSMYSLSLVVQFTVYIPEYAICIQYVCIWGQYTVYIPEYAICIQYVRIWGPYTVYIPEYAICIQYVCMYMRTCSIFSPALPHKEIFSAGALLWTGQNSCDKCSGFFLIFPSLCFNYPIFGNVNQHIFTPFFSLHH